MTVVEQAVRPDQVQVFSKCLLGAIGLLLDTLEQGREVHRSLDDCQRKCLSIVGLMNRVTAHLPS